MFQIGEGLAAAREARGLSLADLERLTNIRAAQLEALEEERFEIFPARAYARAFLRTYANALELDADLFVDEFESRFADRDPVPAPAPRRRRDPPWRALAAGAFVAAAIGYVAWSGLRTGGSPTGPPPPAVSRPSHPARTTRRHSSPATRARTQRRRATPPVVRRLVIRAVRGPCWIEARRGGPTGAVLYEATLRQGGVVSLSAPRVWIRLGAPWNVDVTRGGRPIGGLSGNQAVNRIA